MTTSIKIAPSPLAHRRNCPPQHRRHGAAQPALSASAQPRAATSPSKSVNSNGNAAFK
jgi:hypothetical protein